MTHIKVIPLLFVLFIYALGWNSDEQEINILFLWFTAFMVNTTPSLTQSLALSTLVALFKPGRRGQLWMFLFIFEQQQ